MKGSHKIYAFMLLVVAVVLSMSLLQLPLPGAAESAYASPGTGWEDQTPPEGISSLRDVEAVDADTAWVVGINGTIAKTTDGGNTWVNQYSSDGLEVFAITAANAQTAWAVAYRASPRLGILLKTNDGGLNWTTQYAVENLIITGICAVDEKTLWAAASQIEGYYPSNALIFRSDDGGYNWAVQYSQPSMIAFTEVCAVDKSNAWVVGANIGPVGGIILKTGDGGATWQNQNPGTIRPVIGVSAVNALTAWVVGEGSESPSMILKTSDGGTSWSYQDSGVEEVPTGVSAVDAHTAWLVTQYGSILKTTDGGETWVAQDSGSDASLFRVFAVDAATAWAVGTMGSGSSGAILKTEDGGDARPDITGITPSSGQSGTVVTITGCDFGESQGTSYVSFGSTQAATYTSWSDTQIVVGVPAGITGTVPVTVSTGAGTSNSKEFTVQTVLPPCGIGSSTALLMLGLTLGLLSLAGSSSILHRRKGR